MSSFNALKQVAEFLNKYKLRQIDIIGNEDSQSRFTEFYKLLHDGSLNNDDEAAQHFYGEKANAKTPAYRKFKSQFRDRLLNTMAFIDASNTALSNRQAAEATIQRDWIALTALITRSLSYAYLEFGEQLISEAIKYDFVEIALDVIVKIKSIYATQIGDRKKYEHYDKLYNKYFDILQAEYKAQQLFEKIRINYVNSVRYQPEQAEAAKIAYQEVKPYLEKYDTVKLHLIGRSLELMQYACLNKYTELLPASESMIQFFKNKTFECRGPLAAAFHAKLMCCISLRLHDEGRVAVNECLNVTTEGTVNWFKTLELKVILLLHTSQYRDAFEVYDSVKNHKSKDYLQRSYKEFWLIIEAYLYFLISKGFISPLSIDKTNLGKFKLSKFLNEIEVFTHDKAGLNISILIVQIVLLVADKKFDLVHDYLERIVKYRQRHVSKYSATYRSNEFIKVLEKLPLVHFHPKRFRKESQKYIDNIKAVEVNVFEDGFRLEMIPYDIVWELMIDVMERKNGGK